MRPTNSTSPSRRDAPVRGRTAPTRLRSPGVRHPGRERDALKAYLERIGVPDLPARTSPFDPGYDPLTLEGHLAQSAHLMSTLKISMACWMIASEEVTRRKIALARLYGVETVTGGGPFEVAVAQGALEAYLELCADLGVSRIECGEGFTKLTRHPREICGLASDFGLDVQFEVGEKHGGAFDADTVQALIAQGSEWLDAGARQIIVEGRESGQSVGLYDDAGQINFEFAERFVKTLGFHQVSFEAPTKHSQFALLRHFGAEVEICNVRIEDLLRVEIFRRGLHSDAFEIERLRPRKPWPRRAGECP